MLDVRRLRLLYELDRRGTIAAVAAALHFAPSGVSQQLAQLEVETGLPLLERTGRNVLLTEAAKALVVHAKVVLTQLERAESELAAFTDRPRGTVRIASFQTATVAIAPAALAALRVHSGLRVEVAQSEPEVALPALLARDFDLVICEEYPGFRGPILSDTDREPLCADPIGLARPVSNGGTTLADARDDVWVMEPCGTVARAWAVAQCREAGFEPDVRFQASDMSVHLELVQGGHATAFVPALAWRGRPRPEGFQQLPGQARSLSTVVRLGSEGHPAIRAVRHALRRAAGATDPYAGPQRGMIGTSR